MKRNFGYGLAVCSLFTLLVTGCYGPTSSKWLYPHADHATLGETAHEHERRVLRVVEHDRLLLIEDLDMFFQTDRPTRLTRWHVR